MDSDRFDQLSRLLGRGVHRRAAVAALAALAVGGAADATAKTKHKRQGRAAGGKPPGGPGGPGGNSACAHFCAAVFGADTPAAGQCTSDAAHGNPNGLCARCGTAAPTAICCVRNSAGFCPDAAAAVCPCSTGQTCLGGQCQALGCANPHDPCSDDLVRNCGPGGNTCFCLATPGGGSACSLGGLCADCARSGCPSGQHCVVASCCPEFGGTACVADCDDSAVSRAKVAATSRRRNLVTGRSGIVGRRL